MSGIDRLVAWNHEHAGAAAAAGRGAEPATGVAIVTCMDARISMGRVVGAVPGDVHVIRNAGGIVTEDVVRSLLASQVALGTTEAMIIQHTRCGLEGLDEESFAARVEVERGARPGYRIGGFSSVEDRVRESVDLVLSEPLLTGEVRGFIFDVESGLLHEVG